ncbi:hypothetical protein IDJ77_00215 [Mucilaginibacter sp. ZT4R22]|uniref:Uncharacterized protein n=1 Tax=Mucilaginibacter pankratovii TaxID=2772110 RepID=A0ABR7WIQ0_9SPHI|nr:DUF5990 family protein [Mucilaginibacter pankratovii]MBD1362217.1 hypothetical protein [Mucilaginibacter pankratovii]
MAANENSITLHITLEKPPLNLTYSLQKGSGSHYEPVQVQPSKGDDLQFNLAVEIKGTPETHDMPDFRGPFVQGPVGGRFIYLDIGSYAGGGGWSGRLKIPLTGITWAQVATGMELQTTVPGTGKNGLPNCATVKPFVGWRLK